MAPRLLLSLVVAAALALAAILAFALASPRRADPQATTSEFAGSIRPPGIAPTPLGGLRDEHGQRVDLDRLRGRPVIVTFLYTACEDSCPTTAQQIRGALDDLPRTVPALAISVDPARDTPQRARQFLLTQRLLGRMRYLTGTRAALSAQWRAFGIAPQGAEEHTGVVILLDRQGRQRIGFPADRLTSSGLVDDLLRLGA